MLFGPAFLLTTPLLISNPFSLPELSCQSSLISCASTAVTVRFDAAAGADVLEGLGVTVNVARGICAECLQTGENRSWVAPSAASLGTVKGSEKAPASPMLAVPRFLPHPLTLIDEHPSQPVAAAVTAVPGGPCAGDSEGGDCWVCAVGGGCDCGVCAVGSGCDCEACAGEGWRETDCTAATGWPGGLGLFVTVAARAVAAAATAIAALAAMAALAALKCRSFMRRRRGIWCTAVP